MTGPCLREPLSAMACLGLVCLAVTAHASPPRRAPFSSSAAYRALRSSVSVLLERDADGDGKADVIALQRVGPGYSARVVWQRPGAGKDGWVLGCVGPVVTGEDVEIVQWVTMGSRELLLIVAQETDPDETIQNVTLVDVGNRCKERFSDRIRVPKNDVAVLAPGSVPAGVVLQRGKAIHLVDDPRYLTLSGPQGEIKLLLSVRVRTLEGEVGAVATTQRRQQFLTRRSVTAQWRSVERTTETIDNVVDGSDTTVFEARAGEAGKLLLKSADPLLLLEFRHGCPGVAPVPLVLRTGSGGPAFVTGRRPPHAAPVQAAGRTLSGRTGRWVRDLVALREPAGTIALAVGPANVKRCVREVIAYGWGGVRRPLRSHR